VCDGKLGGAADGPSFGAAWPRHSDMLVETPSQAHNRRYIDVGIHPVVL
jgi:hypothetical protein